MSLNIELFFSWETWPFAKFIITTKWENLRTFSGIYYYNISFIYLKFSQISLDNISLSRLSNSLLNQCCMSDYFNIISWHWWKYNQRYKKIICNYLRRSSERSVWLIWTLPFWKEMFAQNLLNKKRHSQMFLIFIFMLFAWILKFMQPFLTSFKF